jgi:hypothetical protein
MPTVFSFWRLPEEEQDFLAFLDKSGGAVAIPFERFRRKEDMVFQPISELLESENPDAVLFSLQNLADQLRIHAVSDDLGTYYTASPMDSSMIAYERGKLSTDRKLGVTSLAAYWKFLNDADNQFADKPAEFVSWGKRVFRWLRRTAPIRHESDARPCTEKVAKAIERRLILVG